MAAGMRHIALAALVLVLAAASEAYYLPGVAPKNYKVNDKIDLTVNSLSSLFTTVPYEYYKEEFGFCNDGTHKPAVESLGSVLSGDRIYTSSFQLNMMVNTTCNVLCVKTVPKKSTNFLISRIQERYQQNWLVDSLPAARLVVDPRHANTTFYSIGFDLGTRDDKAKHFSESHPQLNNHYVIWVQYHPSETDPTDFRVVGVIVYPMSRAYKFNAQDVPDCGASSQYKPLQLSWDTETKVAYTYDVRFTYTDIAWGTRWDNYLHTYDPQVHWISLICIFVAFLVLSFLFVAILMNTLYTDIARYNKTDPTDDALEEYGWKLVHGDAFRPPRHSIFLSMLAGNGVQILIMVCVTLILSMFGFLSPSIRGSLMTVAIVFYVMLGFAAGYTASRLYKMFGGESWKKLVLLTALVGPGAAILHFITLNFFLVGFHSSAAVPFGTLVALLALWLFVSVPLCFAGAYFGFKKPRIEAPVRTNQIPRQIPPQPRFMHPVVTTLGAALVPFCVIAIELSFILGSLWINRIYYVFGFLFLVFVMLCITTAEVSIIVCYYQLRYENYHWWWRSFFTSGASALYVFLYGIHYYVRQLDMMNWVSGLIYFGWHILLSAGFFLCTGTIGFLACLWFVRKMYYSIKND